MIKQEMAHRYKTVIMNGKPRKIKEVYFKDVAYRDYTEEELS